MASALHRGIVELLRRDPSLAPDLAVRAGRMPPPPPGTRFEAHDGRLHAVSFVTAPREIQVDLLLVGRVGDEAVVVAVVEAQLSPDPTKRYRLLEYVAAARRDHEALGVQIVISPDPEVLEKIRNDFEAEPHFCPILLGPAEIPMITDVDAALARPALATLSAIFHARSLVGPAIIETVVESWTRFEEPCWQADAALLWAAIPEEVMTNLSIPIQLQRFESDAWDDDDDDARAPSRWEQGTGLYQRARRSGLEEGRQEGRQEGRREGLLAALDVQLHARGLIGDLSRLAGHDEDRLRRAIVLAASVDGIDELVALLDGE